MGRRNRKSQIKIRRIKNRSQKKLFQYHLEYVLMLRSLSRQSKCDLLSVVHVIFLFATDQERMVRQLSKDINVPYNEVKKILWIHDYVNSMVLSW